MEETIELFVSFLEGSEPFLVVGPQSSVAGY
jgi:hypothetical protein